MRPVASRIAVDRIGCRASKPVTAVDTTGAGDTFSGVLAKCLASGDDTGAAVRAAATAVSLTVTRRPRPVRGASSGTDRVGRRRAHATTAAGAYGNSRAAVDAFASAWAVGNVDALMALMAPECEFQLSVGPESGVRSVGRAEVERDLRMHLAPAAGRRPEAVGTGKLFSDHFAVTRWTIRAIGGDGQTSEAHGCDVFELDGDLVRVEDACPRARSTDLLSHLTTDRNEPFTRWISLCDSDRLERFLQGRSMIG